MANIPVFVRSPSFEVLEHALTDENGVLYDLDRICYTYLSDTGKLAYIDTLKQIHLIKGDNKISVLNVTELPSVDEADVEVLYICNGVVYYFTGTEFRPTFYEVTIQIDNLTTQLNNAENQITALGSSVETLETNIASFEESLRTVNGLISNMSDDIRMLERNKANAEDVYTKAEVDEKLTVDTGSETVTIVQYVDNSTTKATQDAKDYTDEQIQIHFV